MLRARSVPSLMLAAAAVAAAAPAAAQQSATPPARSDTAKRSLDFSGVVFGNYQYNTGPSNRNANSFTVDRAYLTFRMPAGDHVSVRVTTDVFQDAGSNAYTVRAKYAYVQYDFPKVAEASLLARAGILQTVEIDHEESFWPRYLTNSGVERAGFFTSADVGVASQLTLPHRFGELYAAITNGPGYGSREIDRFKDYQARLSLTPLMEREGVPTLLRSLTMTGWTYRGSLGSRFASGGTGQLGPIGEAMPRTRSGVLLGIKDPRLTIAGEYASATTGTEAGDNTAVSPRTRTDVEANLLYGFAIVRPLAFVDSSGKSPLALVARYDRYEPASNLSDFTYHFFVGGLSYDISPRATIALDYQEQLPSSGTLPSLSNTGAVSLPPTAFKTWFAHFVVNF